MSSDLLYLTKLRFSKDLEEAFQDLAKPLQGRLIAQTDLFPYYYSTGIIVRQINLGLNETLVNDVSRIWSLDHARQLVNQMLSGFPEEKAGAVPALRRDRTEYLISPNLVFNADLTERRVSSASGVKAKKPLSFRSERAKHLAYGRADHRSTARANRIPTRADILGYRQQTFRYHRVHFVSFLPNSLQSGSTRQKLLAPDLQEHRRIFDDHALDPLVDENRNSDGSASTGLFRHPDGCGVPHAGRHGRGPCSPAFGPGARLYVCTPARNQCRDLGRAQSFLRGLGFLCCRNCDSEHWNV